MRILSLLVASSCLVVGCSGEAVSQPRIASNFDSIRAGSATLITDRGLRSKPNMLKEISKVHFTKCGFGCPNFVLELNKLLASERKQVDCQRLSYWGYVYFLRESKVVQSIFYDSSGRNVEYNGVCWAYKIPIDHALDRMEVYGR